MSKEACKELVSYCMDLLESVLYGDRHRHYAPPPQNINDCRPATEDEIDAGVAVWCAGCSAKCPNAGKDFLKRCSRFREKEIGVSLNDLRNSL